MTYLAPIDATKCQASEIQDLADQAEQLALAIKDHSVAEARTMIAEAPGPLASAALAHLRAADVLLSLLASVVEQIGERGKAIEEALPRQ